MSVQIATGPVSWGVDFADDPSNPPWDLVLDQIAASGFRWTELGPVGYLPEDTERLGTEFAARGLSLAGSFLFEPLHNAEQRERILDVARRTCGLIAGVNGRFLVVIDLVDEARAATAGRSESAERLGDEDWRALMSGIEAVAGLARDEFGLRAVLHPHAGSHIEFGDEIDRAMGDLDPALVGLCVDTGHSVYAGLDPVDLVARHRERVDYFHFKDVDPRILGRADADAMDFWSAMEAGLFCPLGSGCVGFAALGELLRTMDFRGWATVEQDRDPRAGSDPLADMVRSREFLEQLGFRA